MDAPAIFKAVVFFLILGVMLLIGYYVRKFLSGLLQTLRDNSVVGRFFGNRSIDTQTDGRIFELTQVSVPDYVLIWVWFPMFLRIYLWGAIAWIVNTLDYRLSRIPIDPWNQTGIIPKTMLEETDKVLSAIDGFFSAWSALPFIVAAVLLLYVAVRFVRVLCVQPSRILSTVLVVLALATLAAYGLGFVLGGAFAGLQRLNIDVQTIQLVTPWRLPMVLVTMFLQAPVKVAIWVVLWWWVTMHVHSSIWCRHRYVPATKQLRLLTWDGIGEDVLNHIPKPKLSVVSATGETAPVGAQAESNGEVDPLDSKRTVPIRWDYCGWLHFIFLFGGMRFKDERTGRGETPLIDVRGFPGLYWMVRRFSRYNTVPASDKPAVVAAVAGKKSRRPFRAIAGKVGRGVGSGAKRVAKLALGRKAKPITAVASAVAEPVKVVANAAPEAAPPVAKHA